MSFAAVIFDLDGTLIDTERLVFDAGLVTLVQFGFDADADLMRSLVGVDDIEAERRLGQHLGTDLTRFNAAWSREIRASYDRGIPLMPGVRELLDLVGLPMAVATNSLTENARSKLSRTGLLADFGAVVGRDAVARPKPAPDVFTEAARRIGVSPADCLAFEDSPVGVEAALSAGMIVVHVPDQTTGAVSAAHHRAENLLAGARAAGLIG